MRSLHSLLGLVLTIPLVVLALSGATLSLYPLLDARAVMTVAPDASPPAVGEVAEWLAAEANWEFGTMSQLNRAPSGMLSIEYIDAAGRPRAELVDPATGMRLGPMPEKSVLRLWIADLHRSFLLGDPGRVLAGVGAAAMGLLSFTGLVLVAVRAGSWRRILTPLRGDALGRFHILVSCPAAPALAFLAVSGLGMALAAFEIIPDLAPSPQTVPSSTTGTPVPLKAMPGLDVPVDTLRSLVFPVPDDPADVFMLSTATGLRVVDRTTGAILEAIPLSWGRRVFEWAYRLHSGEGLPLVGILMGLAASTAPVLAITGALIRRRRSRMPRPGTDRIAGNRMLEDADALILVASEGGATWGFARTLHEALTQAGLAVHATELGDLRSVPDEVREVLILASSYGDGGPPRSAAGVLDRFGQLMPPMARTTVLGFGDRAFPRFGAFPKALDAALSLAGWRGGLPLAVIDQQSAQAFATWGNDLARLLDVPLELRYEPCRPTTRILELVERRLYGEGIQEPTAVLRFQVVEDGGLRDRIRWRLRPAGFGPDRILGVLAPAKVGMSEAPRARFYSISSAPARDEVEICVKRVLGGCTSTWLHDLEIGNRVEAFAQVNPSFVPPLGRAPVILVGAGTGIAPFMGLIRVNDRHRPLHLFWGGRSPSSDFLYEAELRAARADGRLTSLVTAFSRAERRAWVQDRLRERMDELMALIGRDASVMVCGGKAMAAGVTAQFDAALTLRGLSVATLKAQGRWAEDVF